MFSQKKIEEIVDLLITLTPETKIYFGCDSVRYFRKNKPYARYATPTATKIAGQYHQV